MTLIIKAPVIMTLIIKAPAIMTLIIKAPVLIDNSFMGLVKMTIVL